MGDPISLLDQSFLLDRIASGKPRFGSVHSAATEMDYSKADPTNLRLQPPTSEMMLVTP
jgi:hypothetical protein